MTDLPRAAIGGTGYAMPPTVRTNVDPIFDYIKKNVPTHGQLLFGYEERRVLGPGETIEPYMVQAAQQAMSAAGVAAADIDLLLGFTSIAAYLTPNSLAQVHALLGLAPSTWCVPVHADYSNYSASLVLADAMITAGRARNVLIVCGSNWSQNVSYETPPCVSIGDGAGAAVMSASGDASRFRVVDYEVEVVSSGYGGMFTASDVEPERSRSNGPVGSPFNRSYSSPYFHLTPAGVQEFQVFGTQDPPKVAAHLLARNALAAGDVAVICYQASEMLIAAWQAALAPRQMLHTLKQYGNTVIASVAVNVAVHLADVQTDHVLLLSVGAEPHAAAVLLRRNG
jgi:3-oxoacyl-[acyl-carrier-protein] synthase III